MKNERIEIMHAEVGGIMKLLRKAGLKLGAAVEVVALDAEKKWNRAYKNAKMDAATKSATLSKMDASANLLNDVRQYIDVLFATGGRVRITIEIDMHINAAINFKKAMKYAVRNKVIEGQIHSYTLPQSYIAPDIEKLKMELEKLTNRYEKLTK